jgi:hypothetical protein
VALAFERFENECFKLTETIVDDSVDFAAERRMMVFAGLWRMLRVTGIAR